MKSKNRYVKKTKEDKLKEKLKKNPVKLRFNTKQLKALELHYDKI